MAAAIIAVMLLKSILNITMGKRAKNTFFADTHSRLLQRSIKKVFNYLVFIFYFRRFMMAL